VPDLVRKALEDTMANLGEDLRRPFEEKARAQGRAEGRAEALAEAILRVLARRGVQVDAGAAERVRACTDTGQLERWLDGSAVAATGADLFGDETH
jgi:hypothetical protein